MPRSLNQTDEQKLAMKNLNQISKGEVSENKDRNYNGTLRWSESKLPIKQYLAAVWEAGGRERKLHSTLKKVTTITFHGFVI